MTRSAQQWIRAIADCGVLRVSFDDDALIELIDLCFIDAMPVEGNDDALDCRLSQYGKAQVAALNPQQIAA